MKQLFLLFTTALIGLTGTAGTIVLEGKYQNENLFVVNPVSSSGVGFCAFEVTVNGEISTDETNSGAFEIDLTVYGFKPGANVVVTIKHKDGCEPRILNPQALEPKPTFETVSINLTSDGTLNWETKNEQGEIPFIIQQFKWDKWVNVGEVKGNGTSVKNKYEFKVQMVSGENKVRVIQKSSAGSERKTPTAQAVSTIPTVTYSYNKSAKSVQFSAETGFEVYNEYGKIVTRGSGNKVDMSSFAKGEYYINFDSRKDQFTKK